MKASPFSRCELVVNPSRYPEYVKKLRRILKRFSFARVVETQSREHFTEEVRAFARGENDALLVWGGDGTAHTAINALVRAEADGADVTGKAVGFLRGGTGNGIQDSYSVPYRILSQLNAYEESLSAGYRIGVDLLEINDGARVSYGQLLGLGFDVRVLRQREHREKKGWNAGGMLRYILAGLSVFTSPRERWCEPVTLSLFDGKFAFSGTRVNAEFTFSHLDRNVAPAMIEAGTRPFYGKLFKVCPDVVCNDGHIDLYIYDIRRKVTVLRHIASLWEGHHGQVNKRLLRSGQGLIERYELNRLQIENDDGFAYHVDGELRQSVPSADGRHLVTIQVLPERLNVIVPPVFFRLFHPFDFMISR